LSDLGPIHQKLEKKICHHFLPAGESRYEDIALAQANPKNEAGLR
jgi:hypothetical protein